MLTFLKGFLKPPIFMNGNPFTLSPGIAQSRPFLKDSFSRLNRKISTSPLSTRIYFWRHDMLSSFSCRQGHSRHKTLKQCWRTVGPPSTTLDQRYTNIDSTSCAGKDSNLRDSIWRVLLATPAFDKVVLESCLSAWGSWNISSRGWIYGWSSCHDLWTIISLLNND